MRPCALQNEILSLAGEDLFIQGISSSPSAGARSTLLQQRAGLVSGLPVDSTLVLVDPFGPHPVVIAGSHDLTPAASARCDNNLLIVENAPGLAAELTVHIIRLYDRFRFRAVLAAMPDRPGPLSLDSSGAWQRRYFDDAKRSEFNFLFGELWPGL